MNSRRHLKGLRFHRIMNTTAQKKKVVTPNKVLVTGAGLLGVAAIEKFLSAGWDVVGVSLRKPKLPSGRDIQFLSVDLRNEKAARAASSAKKQGNTLTGCQPLNNTNPSV